MKKLIYFVAALVLISVPTLGQKKPITPIGTSDEKAVRKVFDDLLNGIRNSNIDGVTGIYLKSTETVYFNNNGSVTLGWEQDRKNREARYPRTSNVKLEVRDVRVTLLGRTGALVTCLWKQTQDYETVPEAASGRMTLVFQKFGKDWKAIHLHTSPDLPKPERPVFPSEKMEKPEKVDKPLPPVTPTPPQMN